MALPSPSERKRSCGVHWGRGQQGAAQTQDVSQDCSSRMQTLCLTSGQSSCQDSEKQVTPAPLGCLDMPHHSCSTRGGASRTCPRTAHPQPQHKAPWLGNPTKHEPLGHHTGPRGVIEGGLTDAPSKVTDRLRGQQWNRSSVIRAEARPWTLELGPRIS